MGKQSRREESTAVTKSNGNENAEQPLLVNNKAVDPDLAQLFASSSGPVQAPPISRYGDNPRSSRQRKEDRALEAEVIGEEEELSSIDGDIEDADVMDLYDDNDEFRKPLALDDLITSKTNKKEKKRKRKEEDGVEEKYMKRLVREEQKEEEERQAERRLKRQKVATEQEEHGSGNETDEGEGVAVSESDDEEGGDDEDDENSEQDIVVTKSKNADDSEEAKTIFTQDDIPMHESLEPNKDATEIEKASRTVFLANVSIEAIRSKAAKKSLLAHMGSFLDSLPEPPEGKPKHKVESIRFRSTAFAGMSLPKKAAFAKKELMEATTKSTNAYVVYSTAYAAREAVKRLNGSIVLDRHLRVDGVAHPSKIDHRRCVFVGNLGFVDDESLLDKDGENERKRSKVPSDIEEGLWRQFGKAGSVESVRVIRDEKTRVGKGFAYVQFHDPNSVETALLFDDKKYPPMLPRILRVVRAKSIHKTALAQQSRRSSKSLANNTTRGISSNGSVYKPKISSQQASLQGRASRLLGKAGAANFRKSEGGHSENIKKPPGLEGIAKTPETIVFEGFRASAKSGKPKDLKMGGGGKKKGKPKTRSSRRAAEWKKSGSRK
ncbi:hypothetical protein F5884DRAFT_43276 [Xylogone sp. PMI_703]|nr:hypothetical protein F5884DRAFT_43276 [Xylogone sp. PMI_703]